MQKQMQTSSPSNHPGEVHGSHQPAEYPQTPRASAGSCAAVRVTQLHRCKAVWANGWDKGAFAYLLFSQGCSSLPLHTWKTGHWVSQAQNYALTFQIVNTDNSHNTRTVVVIVKGRHRIKCKCFTGLIFDLFLLVSNPMSEPDHKTLTTERKNTILWSEGTPHTETGMWERG